MPETTLTINHADGGSETYTINRDKFEGIRNMTRKLEENAGDPENITGFTLTGTNDSTALTYAKESDLSSGKVVFENGDALVYWTGSEWRIRYDGDTFYSSSEDTEYPWDVVTWTVQDGNGSPTFGSFVGGSIGDSVTDTVSVDHTPADDLRNLLVDAENITINRDEGEEIRTLFIDGVEVTIDRTGEVELIRFVEEFGQPAVAFSLRRLSTAYSGPAVRIRRASDNVEVNVAFDNNGEVSTSSAITNVTESPDQGDTTATTLGGFLTEGGNQDAYVQTWYDQSGNGKDLSQDTAGNQPKIAEAGALLTLAGKPTIKPDGSNMFLQRIDSYWDTLTSSDFSLFVAANKTSDINAELIALGDVGSENSGFDWLIGAGGVTTTVLYRGTEVDATFNGIGTGATLFSVIDSDPSTNGEAYINGAASGTASAQSKSGTADRLTLFARRDGNSHYDGEVSEVIIYASDQSSNRSGIETNIADEYGITLP